MVNIDSHPTAEQARQLPKAPGAVLGALSMLKFMSDTSQVVDGQMPASNELMPGAEFHVQPYYMAINDKTNDRDIGFWSVEVDGEKYTVHTFRGRSGLDAQAKAKSEGGERLLTPAEDERLATVLITLNGAWQETRVPSPEKSDHNKIGRRLGKLIGRKV